MKTVDDYIFAVAAVLLAALTGYLIFLELRVL